MKTNMLLIIGAIFTQFIFGQQTYVPDDNFEQFLIDEGYDTGALNDSVPTVNIETIEVLACNGRGISDITGIEDFKGLKRLNCAGNVLVDFTPISQMENLEELYSINNFFRSVDLSNMVSLRKVFLNSCLIEDLKLNNVPNLRNIEVSHNRLTEIDLSNNPGLVSIFMVSNMIETVNLANSPKFAILYADNNRISEINLSHSDSLKTASLRNNLLTTIDVSTNLALKGLLVTDNTISEIDLSNNSKLEALQCSNNGVETLLLPDSSEIILLWCSNNNIKELDLSKLQVQRIILDNNELEYLDVRNGHKDEVERFETFNNPNLNCILVDDPVYSEANWTEIDPHTEFVQTISSCSVLGIEDEEMDAISIYPIPASESLNIDLNEHSNYSIKTINGQIIKVGELAPGKSELFLSHLSSGLYLMEITSDHRTTTKRILKQ